MSNANGQPGSRLRTIGSHFDNFQKNGRGYKASCPLHDDGTPSLSLNETDDGNVLIHCHAGCPTPSLLSVVGLSTKALMADADFIDKTYDYCDENGELLYQAVRKYPKRFQQRRPDGNGDWIWDMKGVERYVPYNLPELTRAGKGQRVFIPEGEKDVERLRQLGLLATCNISGAGKWREEYNEHFAGRPVVILADNDEAGRAHAQAVAANLIDVAATVRVVELPDLPEKGDVSDWLDSGGTKEQLLEVVRHTPRWSDPTLRPPGRKNTTNNPKDNPKGSPSGSRKTPKKPEEKPVGKPGGYDPENPEENPEGSGAEPVGLPSGSKPRPVLPFPIEVFPGVLRRLCESVAAALPSPVDFIAVMMLAVLGSLIGHKRRIAIKESWVETPLLWTVVVAGSGERKTPNFNIATAPLHHRQNILLAEYLKARDDYAKLLPEERELTPKPRLQQVFVTDATVESLKDVLTHSTPIYTADELAGFVRSMGQYKGGRGDDRQIYLSLWSGTPIVSNRKGNPEPIIIPKPFLAITGGIQPDALPDLIDDAREDGLVPRFLISWPDPVPNAEWTEDTVKKSLEYQGICDSLFELAPHKNPVTVSPAAKSIWVEWYNRHSAEKPPAILRPTWSKAEGHCLRLTLILHTVRQVCNETKSAQVDETSMRGGIALIEYFKSHAYRVFGNFARTAGNGNLPKLLRFIRKHEGVVTARELRLNGYTKTSDEAKGLLIDLEKAGYGSITYGKQGNVTFTLNEI